MTTRSLINGEDLTRATGQESRFGNDEPAGEALIGVGLFLAMVAAIPVFGVLQALAGDFWLVSLAVAVVLVADLVLRDS